MANKTVFKVLTLKLKSATVPKNKGNESLVENVNSHFLTALSHNLKMLSDCRVLKDLSMLKTI